MSSMYGTLFQTLFKHDNPAPCAPLTSLFLVVLSTQR